MFLLLHHECYNATLTRDISSLISTHTDVIPAHAIVAVFLQSDKIFI